MNKDGNGKQFINDSKYNWLAGVVTDNENYSMLVVSNNKYFLTFIINFYSIKMIYKYRRLYI